MSDARHPAVFVDRDGVINRKAPEPGYITCWEELEVLPGVPQAIARLSGTELKVIVVTNQRGVARGLVRRRELQRMHDNLIALVRGAGGRIDGIYCCLHDKGDRCDCRKPAPGLLLQAAQEQRIDLARSWIIGDREHDIVAGQRAGCRATVRIQTAESETLDAWDNAPDHTVADLAAAVELILRSLA